MVDPADPTGFEQWCVLDMAYSKKSDICADSPVITSSTIALVLHSHLLPQRTCNIVFLLSWL